MAALVVEDTAPFARGGDWEPEPLAARKKATAAIKPNADPATARRLAGIAAVSRVWHGKAGVIGAILRAHTGAIGRESKAKDHPWIMD